MAMTFAMAMAITTAIATMTMAMTATTTMAVAMTMGSLLRALTVRTRHRVALVAVARQPQLRAQRAQ